METERHFYHHCDNNIILIVDDDPYIREWLRINLDDNLYSIRIAKDGKEAIACFKNWNPAIIIMDSAMPIMDGFESCQQILSLPNAEDTSIIMMTAVRSDDEFIEKAFDAGAEDFITKPINITILKRRLKLIFQRRNAEQISQAKSNFLAATSHEIRTPMNAIVGIAELLTSTPLTKEQQKYIETLQFSTHLLLKVINNVLDFSKIEAGKFQLDDESFDIRDLITNIINEFIPQIKEKKLNFTLDIDEGIPDIIYGDSVRIGQIFNNLIANALKYTERGFIEIHGQLIRIEKKEVILKFKIKDSGSGIAGEKLSQLFQPYIQAAHSVTQLKSGTGLGLAITKELIELMGGVIEVKSTDGIGSQFMFSLRLSLPMASDSLSNSSKNTQIVTTTNNQNHVLVVEDDEANRNVMQAILHTLGHKTSLAENGKEALQKFMDHTYDIIFMDIQMPFMNGYEASIKIRNQETQNRTPIVAITAHTLNNSRQKCLEAGMDDYITKPISIRSIQSLLDQWVMNEK